jgi:uncharacterized protein YbaR (Trm112 family)
MSSVRPGSPGATRACPHCKETILESATVCPACRHHIRFDGDKAGAEPAVPSPLQIEGSIRQPAGAEAWEYSVVVTIRDERGQELARKLIGVGAMTPNELRTFTLAVEVVPAKSKRGGKNTRH